MKDFELDFNFEDDDSFTQESYDASSSGYTDLFGEKFSSFNPDSIISGNNKLKSGMFDMDIEDSELAIGYKNNGPATTPKPGRFM